MQFQTERSERKAEIANMYHPFARIVSGPTVKDLFIKTGIQNVQYMQVFSSTNHVCVYK